VSRRTGGIGAWLEVLRISNAPTVLTNLLAGAAVGMHRLPAGGAVPAGALALVGTGVLLVYLSGMSLNDAFDARADAVERPGRPIPSGRVSAARATAVGLTMLLVGTSMLAVASGAALAVGLAALVLLYDLLHRAVPGAFLLMAACRGMVPALAALAVAPDAGGPLLWWACGGMAAYVAGISLAARDEVRGFGASARLGAWTLPVSACAPLGLWIALGAQAPGTWPIALGIAACAAAALAAALGMLVARRGAARFAVPVAVGIWIGAIPFVDAATCFLLGHPFLGLACLGLWGVAGALRPRVAAS
jgi:4-hydroxybenzoate polyprenyltransferase